jgi:hypothetical protein
MNTSFNYVSFTVKTRGVLERIIMGSKMRLYFIPMEILLEASNEADAKIMAMTLVSNAEWSRVYKPRVLSNAIMKPQRKVKKKNALAISTK